VRLVNGEFAIESVPRRGTTVRVQIPLPARPPAPDPSASGIPLPLAG
jgi:signal transduction histidine kinase